MLRWAKSQYLSRAADGITLSGGSGEAGVGMCFDFDFFSHLFDYFFLPSLYSK